MGRDECRAGTARTSERVLTLSAARGRTRANGQTGRAGPALQPAQTARASPRDGSSTRLSASHAAAGTACPLAILSHSLQSLVLWLESDSVFSNGLDHASQFCSLCVASHHLLSTPLTSSTPTHTPDSARTRLTSPTAPRLRAARPQPGADPLGSTARSRSRAFLVVVGVGTLRGLPRRRIRLVPRRRHLVW